MDTDKVVAQLVGMGFELSDVMNAVKVVGPTIDAAVEYLLDDSRRNHKGASTSNTCFTSCTGAPAKRVSSSSCSAGRMRQSSMTDFIQSSGRPKRSKTTKKLDMAHSEVLQRDAGGCNGHPPLGDSDMHIATERVVLSSFCEDEENIGPDWENKVEHLLRTYFGHSSLKAFQKEALATWLAHQDCLVLAATGSGKSLCFQIPALLTGKVVVVISPLISLMHDQCLKLSKHGISACFLGSGQIDRSMEQKAMAGMYSIVYVCPETILRLIKPLQSLAESRGIALFAIDEVHCVSKWGHDFRPDYRRLSVLRENFGVDTMKFLKFDIPIMALTATATIRVRGDILQSLHMSKATRVVLTSFFRPNLRFSVKHSRTSLASYEKDFHELMSSYSRKGKSGCKRNLMSRNLEGTSEKICTASNGCMDEDNVDEVNVDSVEDNAVSESDDEADSPVRNGLSSVKDRQLSVEYLEDECDLVQDVDDLDVSCGEFRGHLPAKDFCGFLLPKVPDLPNKPEERTRLRDEPLEDGSTIIYVPTRKETLGISKFLCRHGIKAAAYNAKLPKSHLRQVHKEFHENTLQVVVATIAFGMGIDKLNVRRIIHYGWPQSLEAYYQEAGRAGRDGKVAECVLYANLSRTPTLLPSRRSDEQTKQAYKMLADCFRYGMNTSCCRAKTLVEYFGEHFDLEQCLACDVCINGPPEIQNLKAEAMIFMQVVATHCRTFPDISYGGDEGRLGETEKPNIKILVSRLREQHQQFSASDLLWWRGLARLLEVKGFIREGDDMSRVQIKYPELTERGRRFLSSETEQPFDVHPEADMLLSMRSSKSYSSFSEWGKGWADPEIRRQRLQRKRTWKSPRKRKSRKRQPDSYTVRGRLTAKLSKKK